MKIKKYTNGAWTDLDKPVKKYDTYTDETTTLPLTIEAITTDAIENYQVYGTSAGAGVETENLFDAEIEQGSFSPFNGLPADSTRVVRTTFDDIVPSGTYTISASGYGAGKVAVYAYTSNDVNTFSSSESTTSWQDLPCTFTTSNSLYLRFAFTSGTDTAPSQVYNVMLNEGSTAPTSYIPPGYKIPISLQSGVTENLWDLNSSWTNSNTDTRDFLNANLSCFNRSTIVSQSFLQIRANGQYSITTAAANADYDRILFKYSGVTTDLFIGSVYGNFSSQDRYTISINVLGYDPTTVGGIKLENIMLTKGSTVPDHYIPHRYTSNYDLFIGSTKLGAEEYVDYAEQKIYRMSGSTLVPTDPPAPLPAINTYKGENNLSVDTTVQPEKVAVEYEGWKGVGDVEKYQNGEWSDNNGT